jgi:trehalose/maltose transport system substrate-binding protein
VTLMGLALRAGEELRHDVLDGFTRATGIHVDLIPTLGSSAEQFSQIRRLLERHADTPDVYLIDVIWPGALERHLLDLTPYLDEGICQN